MEYVFLNSDRRADLLIGHLSQHAAECQEAVAAGDADRADIATRQGEFVRAQLREANPSRTFLENAITVAESMYFQAELNAAKFDAVEAPGGSAEGYRARASWAEEDHALFVELLKSSSDAAEAPFLPPRRKGII